MSEWNRTRKAMLKAALKSIEDLDPKECVTAARLRGMLNHVAVMFTEVGPFTEFQEAMAPDPSRSIAEACVREAKEKMGIQEPVKHPDGSTWARWPHGNFSHENRSSFGVNPIELMTPAEAFRKGAVVKFKVNGSAGYYTIEGPITSVDQDRLFATVQINHDSRFDVYFSEMSLVVPAPEVTT